MDILIKRKKKNRKSLSISVTAITQFKTYHRLGLHEVSHGGPEQQGIAVGRELETRYAPTDRFLNDVLHGFRVDICL